MAGKISEYIGAGPLLGTELLDVSQVDVLSMTGYSTKSITLDDLYNYITEPTIYTGDSSLTGNRFIDQDGHYLIFEGGGATYWQVDGVNDGLYYDYLLKRAGVGTEFPDAKWHVKGNSGQRSLLCEDSLGSDTFYVESNGDVYIKATLIIAGEDFAEYNSGTGRFLIGNSSRTNEFVGLSHIFPNDIWYNRSRSGSTDDNGHTLGLYSLTSRCPGNSGGAAGHHIFTTIGATHADSILGSFDNNGTVYFAIYGNGRVQMHNLPVYADEAAAVIGGLATDMLYQTATGELRIKL